MPTNHDETLHERYAREHQAHLAIYARMTPEQISDMATELHNALARLAALSQQAEPTHDLYQAGDLAAPDAIKDLHGDVVLALCKRCGQGEAELEATCPGKAEPCDLGEGGISSSWKRAVIEAQAEPTETYTAVDMATAPAQGFRDGQAAVEQAAAQDWLSSYEAMGDRILAAGWRPETDAQWDGLRRMHAEYAARPAQTEQQPVGYLTAGDCFIRLAPGIPPRHDDTPLYAAPIAQTAPQGKFAIGDRVRKTSGSEWQGRICGTYSTALTPEGYAVESEAHAGSVQIYPAKALEAVDD